MPRPLLANRNCSNHQTCQAASSQDMGENEFPLLIAWWQARQAGTCGLAPYHEDTPFSGRPEPPVLRANILSTAPLVTGQRGVQATVGCCEFGGSELSSDARPAASDESCWDNVSSKSQESPESPSKHRGVLGFQNDFARIEIQRNLPRRFIEEMSSTLHFT